MLASPSSFSESSSSSLLVVAASSSEGVFGNNFSSLNPWFKMSMFCCPSYLNGLSPITLTKSCLCNTSLSNNAFAKLSTTDFFSLTNATVRTYAFSTKSRTSSSIIRAVSSLYGDLKSFSPFGKESNPIFWFNPYTAVMLYAILVTFSRSFCAPVEILPSMTSSAARPPSVMHIMSFNCSVVAKTFSLGRYWAKPKAAEPLGTMETFNNGSACSMNQPTTAWPAS
mmetsp:Transcript_6568/g.19588  ORF Transcript_6568/g.19588 Transcript_6568/m.19588 type:complete len:225 (-) Transcript_6568:2280-2954(-)